MNREDDAAYDASYRAHQSRIALAQYLGRRRAHLLGAEFPDPRDQDLRDREVELVWRAGVRRLESRLGLNGVPRLIPAPA